MKSFPALSRPSLAAAALVAAASATLPAVSGDLFGGFGSGWGDLSQPLDAGIVVGNPADLPEEEDKKLFDEPDWLGSNDYEDVAIDILGQWGTADSDADLDGSGMVDAFDLLLLSLLQPQP